ncbi:MAG TPA: LAGLIDADG family homing endonuclease, partial [Streptosporangiaceae bacterium]|nr:LAGLIDADG family homing endonuclease [Streptosporangiaceae bacterium]
MAASIRFDFLSTGGPELSRQFKSTGDNAAAAARGAKVLQDVIKTLGEKENRTAAESRTLAAALRQTGDAEDRAAAKALAADIAIRRLDDALKDSGKSAAGARGGIGGLAGEISGFGAAADAASSGGSKFKLALAGLNIASGVAEPALAGVVVAAGGAAAAFTAAGLGVAAFGLVAKSVLAQASTAAKAYTAAQQKLALASTPAQRLAALKAEKTALYGLDSAQKSVVFSLIGAQKAWQGFTKTATPGVARVLAASIRLLPSAFALLKPFLAPVETALTGIIGEMRAGIGPGSRFSKIMGDFAAHSGTELKLVLETVGHLFMGVLGVVHAFLPAGGKLLVWAEQASEKFAKWGETLSSHTGFQSLMATFKTETPQAMAILRNLGTVLVNVGKAMFGLSTFSNSRTLLAALLPLSGILASLSQNQGLTRVVLYLVAATTAARKLGPAFLGIKAAVAFFPAAAAAITAFAGVTEGATVAETIAAAATRAWGLAMDALPWVALAAAVVAVAVLVIKYHRQIWAFTLRVWRDILGAVSRTWHWIAANWPLLLAILTGPIGVAALEIIRHWHDIQHALGVTLAAITTAWNTVWGALRTAFRVFIVNGVLGPLGWIIDGAAKAFGWIPGLGSKLKGAAKAFDQFKANVNASLGGINGRTVNVSVAMTSSTNPFPGGISGRKAAGGKITGPGGPRADTAGVFALSNGEWVIQSQSAARYGPAAMDAVNQGKAVIGYAAGGGVGVNVNAQTPSAKSVDAALMGSVIKLAVAFAKTLGGSGQAIADYAMTWLGKIPYVWGGTAVPGGADCCIIGSMHVQTIRGPVEIRDIQAGDEVYTWSNGKPSVNRVTWRSEPRYQQVYRLRTRHREITASGNHPFLTLRNAGRCTPPVPRFPERERLDRPYNRRARHPVSGGEVRDLYLAGASLTEVSGALGVSVTTVVNRLNETGTPRRPVGGGTPGRPRHSEKRAWELSWVNLEDLRRGDLVVTLRSLPDDAPAPDDPLLADIRFLWLLGLAFGDGTLSAARPNRITLCVFGDLQAEVQDRLEDFCGKRGTPTATNGLRLHSEILASGLRRYGMDARSTERIPPRELWTLPHSHIQAFLDGYTAADGHRVKRAGDPALSYKAANRGLVEDVRNLHMILGHNVTKVRELKRTRPIVIRGKEVRNARSLWTFEAYETGIKLATAGISTLRRNSDVTDLFPADSHFAPQLVTSIEPLGTEDTYDITVEDTHNFVAEGLVVHNSGFTQAVLGHFGIHAPRTSEAQGAWVTRSGPQPGALAFYHSPAGGADPGHVAIVRSASQVISQGGGMGPTLIPLHALPLLWTGIPPGGFPGGGGGGVTGTGQMSGAAIARLWTALGGPASAASNMAQIAFAESADRPGAVQTGQPAASTGWGLY